MASALELLRTYFERDEPPEPQHEAQGAVEHFPSLPPLGPGETLTATDILGWWFRPPGRGETAWDAFFQPSSSTRERPAEQETPLAPPRPPASTRSIRSFVASWSRVRSLVAAHEAVVIDEHAEGAVECLYEFLHAIGRRDVDGAMAKVTDDFHAMEGDRELDKRALRLRIEALLETFQDSDISASLGTVPEPLFHPEGLIIYADIQVDGMRVATGEKRTHLDRRIAVLAQQPDGTWAIRALSPVGQ